MLQNYLMFAFLAPKRVSKSRSFPKACRVERGEIKNVLFRFLARLVVGFAGTVEALLRDLGGKYGETVIVALPGSAATTRFRRRHSEPSLSAFRSPGA
jgi:hypothetical protein